MIATLILAMFIGAIIAPSANMDLYLPKAGTPTTDLGGGPVRVTFLGTSTLLFQDNETNLLVDGFFTRPGKLRTALGEVKTNKEIVHRVLKRLGIERVAAVMVVHSHYDHALDAAYVADYTNATLYGSESTLKIGRGGGLPDEQLANPRAATTTDWLAALKD